MDVSNDQLTGWFSGLGSNAELFETAFQWIIWAVVSLSALFAILSLSFVLIQKINPNVDAAKRTELNTKIRTILVSLALIFVVFTVVGTIYEVSGKLTGIGEVADQGPIDSGGSALIDFVVNSCKLTIAGL